MSRGVVWMILVAMIVASLGVSGCRRSEAKPNSDRRFTGPVEPLDLVVARFNQNVRPIQTLWAAGNYEANLVDEQGKKTFVNGDASVLFAAPGKFRFFMNKIGNRLFDAGTDGEKFWLVGYEGVDQAWAGSIDALNRPGAPVLPVRPDLLAQVLGVSLMPTDLLGSVVVTQRFNPDVDVYMLTFAQIDEFRQDRYRVTREVWLDRKTLLPTFVFLFDSDGQVALRARLGDHQPVQLGQASVRIARRFDLLFPQSKSTLTLKLSDMKPKNRGVPNATSFAFSLERANVSKVTHLDPKP